MNNFIDRKDWNFVYPVKYGIENSLEIYCDLVPEYSDMFIYDGDKVKGADGYCIISHEEHARLMEAQSNGYELRYNQNGQIIAYEKKPYPINKELVKPEYDYKNEKWVEKATSLEVVQKSYDNYSMLDTPRFNRVMIKDGIIDDYDKFMLECENYIDSNSSDNIKINENNVIPKPSPELELFYNKMKGVIK